MITIGIDPGLQGSAVAINDQDQISGWFDCPVVKVKGSKRDFLPRAMASGLLELGKPENSFVFLESAQAMPKQGLSSTFKTGEGFGIWQGIIAALGYRYEIVKPRLWQKHFYKGIAAEGKARSIIACQRLFPDLPLTSPRGRVASLDGRADGTLLAAYGRLHGICK
jgi:hypothetical protein